MWPTFLVHFMFEVPFPHCVMWLVSHYLCTRVGSSCVACCAVTSGPDVIEEKEKGGTSGCRLEIC